MRHFIKFYFCTWSLCDLVAWDTCVFPTMLSWHFLTSRGRASSLSPYAASADTVGRMLWLLLDDDEWFTFFLALLCQHHSLYVCWCVSVWVCVCLSFSISFLLHSEYWSLGPSLPFYLFPPPPRPSLVKALHTATATQCLAFSKGDKVNCMVFGNSVKSLSY